MHASDFLAPDQNFYLRRNLNSAVDVAGTPIGVVQVAFERKTAQIILRAHAQLRAIQSVAHHAIAANVIAALQREVVAFANARDAGANR